METAFAQIQIIETRMTEVKHEIEKLGREIGRARADEKYWMDRVVKAEALVREYESLTE